MKKSLIALAALAATASFAQSTVTLSGVVDFAYGSASGSALNNATKLQTVSQSNYTASTSAINFAVVEDLGGGLRAEARYEIDPRAWSNGTGVSTAGALGRHQSFVGLSGGFGAIKLGVMNAGSLNAYSASSPLGTGIGSGFSFSDHTAVSVGTVRYNNSVRYDTPRFNGFAGSLTYAPGNADAGTVAGQTSTNPQITNLGVTYSQGPLNVAFSSLQTGALTGTGAAPKSTYNYIGANYSFGAARLFAGYGDGDKSAAVTANNVTSYVNAKVTRVGATYTMGAVTLLGQYATTKLGTAPDRKTTGLRADYALSKRTVAYLGYEAQDTGAASANKTNLMAVGVRHNF